MGKEKTVVLDNNLTGLEQAIQYLLKQTTEYYQEQTSIKIKERLDGKTKQQFFFDSIEESKKKQLNVEEMLNDFQTNFQLLKMSYDQKKSYQKEMAILDRLKTILADRQEEITLFMEEKHIDQLFQNYTKRRQIYEKNGNLSKKIEKIIKQLSKSKIQTKSLIDIFQNKITLTPWIQNVGPELSVILKEYVQKYEEKLVKEYTKVSMDSFIFNIRSYNQKIDERMKNYQKKYKEEIVLFPQNVIKKYGNVQKNIYLLQQTLTIMRTQIIQEDVRVIIEVLERELKYQKELELKLKKEIDDIKKQWNYQPSTSISKESTLVHNKESEDTKRVEALYRLIEEKHHQLSEQIQYEFQVLKQMPSDDVERQLTKLNTWLEEVRSSLSWKPLFDMYEQELKLLDLKSLKRKNKGKSFPKKDENTNDQMKKNELLHLIDEKIKELQQRMVEKMKLHQRPTYEEWQQISHLEKIAKEIRESFVWDSAFDEYFTYVLSLNDNNENNTENKNHRI